MFSCNGNLSDIPDDCFLICFSFSLCEINGSQNISVHADHFTHLTCLYITMYYAFCEMYAQTMESISQLAYVGKKTRQDQFIFRVF